MALTNQAIIIGVCNIIIFLGIIVSLFFLKVDILAGNKAIAVLKIIAGLLWFLIMVAIQVYSINCMVVGDCIIWTWILVAFAILGTLIYIFSLIYALAFINDIQKAGSLTGNITLYTSDSMVLPIMPPEPTATPPPEPPATPPPATPAPPATPPPATPAPPVTPPATATPVTTTK